MKKGIRFLSTFLLCVIAGCASPHAVPHDSSIGAQAPETSFEVTYSLGGHGEHHLRGSSANKSSNEAHVATYLERELIKEADVHAENYSRFYEKLVTFAQKIQRAPSQEHDCRAPYSITIKTKGKSIISKGCRLSDDGVFAKLVREGEFLLYSKK